MTATINPVLKKKLFLTMLISSAVLFGLIALVLSPLYSVLSSNIVYYNTVIPDIIVYVIQTLNFIAFSFAYAIIIYSVVNFGMRESASLIITYISAIFLKYTADMLISSLLFKSIQLSVVISSVFAFIIDLVLALAISFIAYCVHTRGGTIKRSAVISGILVALSKVLSRIIYDISIGPPENITDLLWMLAYYFSDLIVGGIFFALSILIFKYLGKIKTAD